MSIFNQIGHSLDPNRIINEAHRGIDDLIRNLEANGHRITEECEQHLRDSLTGIVNQVKDEFNKDIEKLKDTVSHIADLKDCFTGETIKGAIELTLKYIHRYPIVPNEAELGLSLITVFFDDITTTKIEHLQKHLDTPPSDRAGITDLILTLLPTKIHVGGTLFTLFSDALAVRGGVAFTGEQIATIVNHILDDIGV